MTAFAAGSEHDHMGAAERAPSGLASRTRTVCLHGLFCSPHFGLEVRDRFRGETHLLKECTMLGANFSIPHTGSLRGWHFLFPSFKLGFRNGFREQPPLIRECTALQHPAHGQPAYMAFPVSFTP
eukprot:scaffold112642_cov17-Tisochrysis_lutea.AAC.1